MAFQTITPVQLGVQAISATPTVDTVYTVPASTRAMIKDISVCNTTAAAITLRIHLVASAGSPTAANALFYDTSIAANTTMQWNGLAILNAAGTIQTQSSAVGLTAHFSGGEAV